MRQIRNLISLCIVFIFSKDLIYPDCEQYIFNEIFRDEFEGSFATRSGETIDSQNNFVVVDEDGVLLIYPKGEDQAVKDLRTQAKDQFGNEIA